MGFAFVGNSQQEEIVECLKLGICGEQRSMWWRIDGCEGQSLPVQPHPRQENVDLNEQDDGFNIYQCFVHYIINKNKTRLPDTSE